MARWPSRSGQPRERRHRAAPRTHDPQRIRRNVGPHADDRSKRRSEMSKAKAEAIVELLRHDMGGHNELDSRIAQEVLRLRGEGQEELAAELDALRVKAN